jgi:predicted DNA-binding WGR domain protein/Leucine-rich repeat (LRR) protein
MKRLFEFRDGSSAKFWEITLEGSTVITRYGKIGSVGNNAHKSFADEDAAKKEFEKLVKEKTKKGYLEPGVTNAAATSSTATSSASVLTVTTTAGVTTYLEHPDQNEFFEVHENNNQVRVRRGKIGQPCLEYHAGYKTKGRENYDRLIKEWKKKGFKITQPKTPILAGSIADELIASEIEDHPVYSRIFDMGWGEELRGQQKRIFVFKNGLNWVGNLDFEEMVDMDLTTGVIIEGDVHVSGVLSQLTYEYPNPILITGNVTAQSFGHKDSHMRIDGDLRVENIVYGEYNDGSLEIGGDVHGKAWISADHSMYANGTYFLPSFHDEYDGLSAKVLNFEGGLDWDALREFIWENKNPLRKDFVFTPPEPKVRSGSDSVLEQKMASGEQVESFKESDRAIQILVETMTGKTGGKRTVKLLENPPPEALIRCHSSILLCNALLKNKDFPGAYLGLLERLVELGCDPRFFSEGRAYINESLLTDQADVVELMQRLLTNKPVWKPEADAQTEPQESELRQRVIVLAGQEDVEGMTKLLETWPDRNEEWLSFVGARLEAPSSTPEQRERLRALIPVWTAPVDNQVGEAHQAHPDVQAMLEVMTYDNVDQILQMLATLNAELLKVHSWLLLDSARYMIEYGSEEYIRVIEKLLELGCDPRLAYFSRNMVEVVQESDDESKGEILELFYQKFPRLRPITIKPDTNNNMLRKLIDLENQKANFDSDEHRLWLEGITELEFTDARLERIPESIGRLINLKSLVLKQVKPMGQTLPESIGDLVHLEHLILGHSDFTQIPDLSKLTKLKTLNLRGNRIQSLTNLPASLETLQLDSNPKLETLDLTGLKRLKELWMMFVEVSPQGLESLDSLELLEWGSAGLKPFPEAIAQLTSLKILRMSFNKFVTIPDIRALRELREVDFSYGQLIAFPESLFDLPKLETVRLLKSPNLDTGPVQSLRKRGVDVTADEQDETEEPVQAELSAASKKILAKTKSLNKSANKIMQAQPAQALEQYSQALEMAQRLIEAHPDEFAYQVLFALQGKLWCVNELVGTQPERTQEAIALAHQVLEFTQQHFEMYYSEMGALSRGSQTLAHNTLAWYALQTGVGLEAALENADSAIEELDSRSEAATYAVVLETKTKILFALERHDEAFACIYRMNREFPDVAYFKAQAQTPAFKRWDAEN